MIILLLFCINTNSHTLLYGVEADSNFETCIYNLYVGGDGAGITRGLAQAGANGIKVARAISEKESK